MEKLKTTFFSLVAPDLPNEWDVEEAVENLLDLDETMCRSVFDQVQVIWPISHSLCFDYLKMAASALDCIELDYLSEWVNRTLDQYEKNGLRAAQRFMADIEENFLCSLRGESGLQFRQVERRLVPYLRGLSGRPLDLASADTVYTDTATIYIPEELTWSKNDGDNFFLYKLITTYQWAFIAGSSFTVNPESRANSNQKDSPDHLWLQGFLNSFANPELARDLYHFLETVRISTFLETELPGLMRRKKNLFSGAGTFLQTAENANSILARLQRSWLSGFEHHGNDRDLEPYTRLINNQEHDSVSAMDSVAATRNLYSMVLREEKSYQPVIPFIFQGQMNLEAVRNVRNQRIEEARQQFIDALATRIIRQPPGRLHVEKKVQEIAGETSAGENVNDQGIALIVNTQNSFKKNRAQKTLLLTVDNEEVNHGDELELAAANVIHELGYLPEKYISSAVGRAGSGYAAFNTQESDPGQELTAPVTYDEWDYRRSDFRKNWCSIREKEIPLSRSNFQQKTLDKYHGQLIRLRYQFEMMRNRERFVRRQRDGEDIDLDALVESLSDVRAGLPPSDRLFVRLKKDERDIAVLFLIDMSNSTQGWVGKVIKESLVLLCEALEVVGDRYAIYGFSGMRRLRSDYFHIKHIDEPYDEFVKQRIGSIAPREYTRMGPAIRHAASLLQNVDSRVKLLITLTDGKPEDYDDYKGEYAIEDTRHALIEAKLADIHPFCITIDRHARDYIEHMYGDVNYIQIDDTRKLPFKIPEIYRILTH
ncbi:MAG: VWA domain-containing protein [Desulfobulbaceae bacterium]|nr:VWA domain-containing protein [Desulfobulbaceae bacterium]